MPAKKKVVVKKQVKFMGATGKVPIKASKSVATKPVPKRRKPRSRAVSTVAYLGNGRIWSFPASKGPPHIMVLPDSGPAICSCTFKRRRGTCSHEEAMNMMGMAVDKGFVPGTNTRVDMPFSALRDTGLLWLVNRVVFHPRGFALGLVYNHEGEPPAGLEPVGWKLLADGSEVWTFTAEADDEGFAKVEAFLADMSWNDAAQPDKPITGISINTINTPDLDWHVAE